MEKRVSGTYIYNETQTSRNLKSIWQSVYKEKQVENLSRPVFQEQNPTDKHRMYCDSFIKLGFFEGL